MDMLVPWIMMSGDSNPYWGSSVGESFDSKIPSKNPSKALKNPPFHTHTHTHTYIYIYIYIYWKLKKVILQCYVGFLEGNVLISLLPAFA